MMLEATNIGFDNIWIEYFDKEKTKEEFNLPKNEELICLIPLGYAAEDYSGNPLHNNRKELTKIAKYI